MTSNGDSSAENRDGVSSPTEELGGREKHSKRAGEPDPGLDPRPYESSNPGQEAVQRTGAEERTLHAVGESAAGEGVDGAEAADAVTGGASVEDPQGDGDGIEIELVNQPAQPNMGPPHTAPAPDAPRRQHD